MTLIVFDAGLRTTTPWYNIFPPKDVAPLQESKASNRVEKHEDRAPEFEQSSPQTGVPNKNAKTAVYEAIKHPAEEYKPVRLAKEIMTPKVVTLEKQATINDAWRLVQYQPFRHIPVLDNQKLCGLISDRDILAHTSSISLGHNSRLDDPVQSIMVKKVVAGRPDTEIRLIAHALIGHRIGAVPIIDDQDQLVGIVTRSDVLKTLLHRVPVDAWG